MCGQDVVCYAQDVGGMLTDCLGDMLPSLTRGLVEWRVALRVRAARALWAALQLAGSACCDHLVELLPALMRARGAATFCFCSLLKCIMRLCGVSVHLFALN